MTRDDEIELGEAGGLAYRSAGAGRPLVLLHPGPGLDGSVFFPEVLTLTDAGVRVVAFDLPANGRSPAGDPADWTIAGYARRHAGRPRPRVRTARMGPARPLLRRLRRARAQQPERR